MCWTLYWLTYLILNISGGQCWFVVLLPKFANNLETVLNPFRLPFLFTEIFHFVGGVHDYRIVSVHDNETNKEDLLMAIWYMYKSSVFK